MKNLLILCASILLPTLSMAEDTAEKPPEEKKGEKSRYVGILLGNADVRSSTNSSYFLVSARLGTTIKKLSFGDPSIGLYLGGISTEYRVGTANATARDIAFASEILLRNAFETGLYFGTRLGIAIQSGTVTTPSVTSTGTGSSLLIGGVVGYEFPMSPVWSFVSDIALLSIGSGTADFPGVGVATYSSARMLSIQVGASVHF